MPRPDVHSSSATELLATILDAVVRRIRAADILRAVAAGAAVSILTLVALALAGSGPRAALPISLAVVALTAAAFLARRQRLWTRAVAAQRLERSHAESRNLIVTAEELLRRPGDARSVILDRVVSHAAGHASSIAPADVVPLRKLTIVCAVALATWTGGLLGIRQRAALSLHEAAERGDVVSPGASRGPVRITATLAPPAYLGVEAQRLEDPERIEAITGTQLSLTIAGDREPNVRVGSRTLELTSTPAGAVAAVTLAETTYLAVEGSVEGSGRRLIPIVITPDRAPAIRIEQPGKDLLLPNAAATIPVAATATDDFGLASLELRFTKVSGSGEQFEFEEGTIPLQLTRRDDRDWKGRAALALSRMNLQPGDSVVYRVVGADRRPADAGLASSDTFFVEVAGPDQVTLAGFELPPDRERYALSQQMILLKIQRLSAREKSMTRDAVAEEAGAIAAEQRSVRANFVFLTGGHVEDEEEEAEHSHEIQEGRLEHSARREINAAIQHMSRAEQALIAVDTAAALPPARAAVEALQRAFGRNRYFLRTLPVRSRLDPARRLSGDLDRAVDSRRTVEEPEVSSALVVARDILAELLDLAPALAADPGRVDAARLTAMAERALAVDAASPQWQQISMGLLQLRDAIGGDRDRSQIQAQLARTIGGVRIEAQRGAVAPLPTDQRSRALRGAWASQAGSR